MHIEDITNADYAFEKMYGDWDRRHPFFLQLRLGRRHNLYPCYACSKVRLRCQVGHFPVETRVWNSTSSSLTLCPYLCHPKDYLDLYIGHMARSMGKQVHSIEDPDERCLVKRGIDMKKARARSSL